MIGQCFDFHAMVRTCAAVEYTLGRNTRWQIIHYTEKHDDEMARDIERGVVRDGIARLGKGLSYAIRGWPRRFVLMNLCILSQGFEE